MSDLERALPALRHALRTLHLPDGPFGDALPARLLLSAGDAVPLEPPVFDAVRGAALERGHEHAWLVPYRWSWDGPPEPAHAVLLDLADRDAYLDWHRWPERHPTEHVLVARDAAWAVITSDEGDALLGGPPDHVAAVRAQLPDPEDRRVRTWLRWGTGWELGLLGHLGLDPPAEDDPFAAALGDEGECWLSVEPAHAGIVLALARLGRPDRTFDRDEGLDRDIDPARLPEEARATMRGERRWFQVRVVGPDVVLRVGEGWLDVRLERADVLGALQDAVAPARLVPLEHYAPHVRAAMAARLASGR